LLECKGIQPQHSLLYAHYQNLVERYVQTITKAVSTIIHGQALLQSRLWDYALFYVVNCRNLMPNSKTGRETPSQMVTGAKYLDLQRENLFSFGKLVIVHNTEKTWKFDVKNDVALYLGHPRETVSKICFCSSSVPIKAVEMMKYLPQKLRDSFEQLWKNRRNKNIKSPSTTDRVTRSMTSKGNVKELAAKSSKLKVRDVLQSEYSAKWIEVINLEVNSLVNNFKCLVPEEIDYKKYYDCIHATIDLKVKYLNETIRRRSRRDGDSRGCCQQAL
jgi:hypothetical protein